MKCLIVKVKDRKRTPTYKKMISGKDVYSFPSNLHKSPVTSNLQRDSCLITEVIMISFSS